MRIKTMQNKIDSMELLGPRAYDAPIENTLEHPNVKEVENKEDLNKYSKFLVGGEVVHFNKGVSAQHKQDVLHSKLLAQLHSNHVTGSQEKSEEWYKNYTTVLENIGWAINAFKFERMESSKDNVMVDKILIEAMASVATGSEASALIATLDGIKQLEDSNKQISLFHQSTTSSSGGKFQISNGKINKNGDIELSMGSYYTDKTDDRGSFLFISWGKLKRKIWCSAQSVVLDSNVYDTFREQILEKLSIHSKNYIKALSI